MAAASAPVSETTGADALAVIRVFTTRPDTLFGATYMVLSPEHPLVDQITTPEQQAAVAAYKAEAATQERSGTHRAGEEKDRRFHRRVCDQPGQSARRFRSGSPTMCWPAYGTGAIMAVPAHDERDFEFAKQFGLPIRTVVRPPAEWLKKTGSTLDNLTEAFVDVGVAVNSGEFDGLTTPEFKAKIIAWLEESGLGQKRVNTKLRDWLFSRQRYWGEPFPILHELDADGQPTGLIEAVPPKSNCRCGCRSWRTSNRPASPSRRLSKRPTG